MIMCNSNPNDITLQKSYIRKSWVMKASKFWTSKVHNGVYWWGMVKTRSSQITDVKSHEPAEQANQKQVTIKTRGTTMW